jgi:hypothetical protein
MSSVVFVAGDSHHLTDEHAVIARGETVPDLAFDTPYGILDTRRFHLERGDYFHTELPQLVSAATDRLNNQGVHEVIVTQETPITLVRSFSSFAVTRTKEGDYKG